MWMRGRAEVLVAASVGATGLDSPASNTIIINRADRFGLAQLYQLRGRVGRERQQAYAYLLVPADGRVDEQAQRRLRALQEFTELGSGFKLALRDLEIRGAGNLLGAEQHGHIAAVGFDLYAKRLGVEKLEAGEGVAFVTFAPGTPLDPRRLVRAIEGSRGRLKMKREFTIEAVVERGEWARVRGSLLRLLESLDQS